MRDPGEDSAAVLTGSTNFTLTDTGTNLPGRPKKPRNNRNHVLIVNGQRDSEQFLDEFMRLRSGTFGAPRERVEPKPAEFRLGKIRVKPLFAPRHGPEMEIMKQVVKARAR